MIETILIVIIIIGFLINSMRKPKNYPPGPIPLPIAGSFLHFDQNKPQHTINVYYENYGPHVGLLMGSFKVVIVSGWQALNEAFNNEDLLGRPDTCLNRDRFDGENYGIIFTDGDDWRSQRRFSIHHFRNLGFGRKSHEMVIQEEAEALLDTICKQKGKPFFLEGFVSTSVLNMTWALLGGKRFDHSDEEIHLLASYVKDCLHDIKMFGSIAIAFPWLRYIFPRRMGYTSVKRGSKGIKEFLQKVIKDHEETRDRNNPRDFIDIYLEELQKPDVNPSFSVKQLEGFCMDMLCAGGDTTLSVISFAILFLCLRKDLQTKIFDEIMEHVGQERLPSTEDKQKLVYAEAVLMEVLRMRTPAPTTIPHRALRNTTLGNYFIPKDTIIVPNVNSIFMDKPYWKDPENFRPERFITEEGKLRRDERLIPFGKGKRACIGETLAKSSSFIFVCSLVQKFSFSLDPSLPIPKTEGVPGFTMAAPFYQIVVTPRN